MRCRSVDCGPVISAKSSLFGVIPHKLALEKANIACRMPTVPLERCRRIRRCPTQYLGRVMRQKCGLEFRVEDDALPRGYLDAPRSMIPFLPTPFVLHRQNSSHF